ARERDVEQTLYPHPGRIQRALLQMVRRRRTQRLGQLPGPAHGHARGEQDRHHLRGRRRHRCQIHLQRAARARGPVRQRTQGARPQKRRPRGAVHAHDGGRRDRNASLRAPGRDPQRGVRRLLGQGPARAHRGHRGPGRDHRQCANPRRARHASQGRGGRGAGAGRLRSRQDRAGVPAYPGRLPHADGARPHLRAGPARAGQHCTGRYLLWAKLTMDCTFDLRAEDVFWCTADLGWVTGHTYVASGPLAAGGTQIIFEGVPTYPDAGRFWQMIQRHKCSVFYTAPTAVRALIKASEVDPRVHPQRFDLSSLRIIGSVGEPINPEAWVWYYRNVGGERCPIVDTWWQTETGGHMINPLPGVTALVPGSCTLPLPGIQIGIVDETGHDMPNGSGGMLVIKRPWPSMVRTLWGDPERFKKSYFPEELGGKTYLAGDGAVRSTGQATNGADRGYFRITGRIDDVLNVSGHRMGTMEIESALAAKSDLVAEAAVVGRPDDLTGEAICAFVVLKGGRPQGEEAVRVANELRNWIAKEIGPIAKPKDIRFGDNLPKTRSGKIMRRLLRSIAKGEAITQDVSTLENPQILEQLAQRL